MKKHILLLFVALLSFSAWANSPVDTVIVVNNPSSIVIKETPGNIDITINNNPTNRPIASVQQSSIQQLANTLSGFTRGKHWSFLSEGLGFGFVGAPGAGKTMDVQMGKSFEWQWLIVAGVRYTPSLRWQSNLKMGFGIDWRNYRNTRGMVYEAHSGVIFPHPAYDEYSEVNYTRLKVFTLQFPLLWEQYIGRHCSLAFGPVFNWNVKGSVKTGARTSDFTDTQSYNSNVGLRKFSIDAMAVLRICSWAGLYLRYSPYTVLNSPGPRFHSISTGIFIAY